MTLRERLSLINLPKIEEEKALRIFLATISLLDDKDLKDVLSYLKEKNVQITKANELKVLCISKSELEKKFSILGEIKETDVFVSDPKTLALNAIDLYKRIQSCKANGVEYKTSEGYSNTIKSEAAFNSSSIPKPVKPSEDKPFEVAPSDVINNNLLFESTEPMFSEVSPKDDKLSTTGIIDFEALNNNSAAIDTGLDVQPTSSSNYDELKVAICSSKAALISS